jgi:tRNA A-37 threonylcarbamoyl transferase component Bud32
MNPNLDLSLSHLKSTNEQSQIDSLDGESAIGDTSSKANQLWGKFTDGVSDALNKAEIEKMQQQRLNYKK